MGSVCRCPRIADVLDCDTARRWHMRGMISVSLPRDLKRRLDELVESSQMNRNDVVREALRQYIHRADFRQLRREMIPQAESQRIYTDVDVLGCVS